MRRLESKDPEMLEFRGGGGVLIIPGIAFLAVGAVVAALLLPQFQRGEKGALPAIVFGFILLALGFTFVFGRSGLEIDLRRQSYRKWWGLLVPIRSRVGSLDVFDRVSISRTLRRQKNRTYYAYPVDLAGQGKDRLRILESTRYEASRSAAGDLAKKLGWNLLDSTIGAEVIRDPQHVDESLRDRARREARPPKEVANPPENLRTKFTVAGKVLRFELPPQGFQPRLIAPLVALAIFESVFALVLFAAFTDNNAFANLTVPRWVFLSVLCVLFLLLPCLATVLPIVSQARTVTIVEASPENVRVESLSPFSRRSRDVPANAVQEVLIDATSRNRTGPSSTSPGRRGAIILRGNGVSVAFGEHLALEEKQWIRDVIEQVLTA
jgi:hypothetical protein